MRTIPHRLLLSVFLIYSLCFADASAVADRQPIVEALQWVRAPLRNTVQYDYVMTARVHLILVSLNSTCFFTTGSYFLNASFSVLVRAFFFVT